MRAEIESLVSLVSDVAQTDVAGGISVHGQNGTASAGRDITTETARPIAKITQAAEAIVAHARTLPERADPPATLAKTLTAATAVGGRFDLETAWSGPEDGRILASELTDAQIEEGVRLRAIGLNTTDDKIAANMWLQWYCYRMAAPLLASWTLHRRVPDMSAGNIAFRFDEEGRPAFAALVEMRGFCQPGDRCEDAELAPTADLKAEIIRVLLDEHLLPLAARVRARYRLGSTIVRGTVASQIGMALTAIDGNTPTPWERVAGDALDLLGATQPLIDGLGRSGDVICTEIEGRTGMTFRRGTCCIVYQIPGKEMCGGCPLRDDEDRAGVYGARLAARPDWACT